jgi:hypothetical protein
MSTSHPYPPPRSPHPAPSHHTSSGHCQSPGFPHERFSSLGGNRSAKSPNSKPYFILLTNQPVSPPVELDTCRISSQTQSALPRQYTRPPPLPPVVEQRCWIHLDASPDTRIGMPPLFCRERGRGPSGSATNPPTPPPSFFLTNHTTHPTQTHVPWSLLRRSPSSARPWYPPTPSDSRLIPYHRSRPTTLMGLQA